MVKLHVNTKLSELWFDVYTSAFINRLVDLDTSDKSLTAEEMLMEIH